MSLLKGMPIRLIMPLAVFAVLIGLLAWVSIIFFASAGELRAAAKEDGRFARIEISTGRVEGNVTVNEPKEVSQMPKRRGKSVLAQRQDEPTTVDGNVTGDAPSNDASDEPADKKKDAAVKPSEEASKPQQKEEIEVANVPEPEKPVAPIAPVTEDKPVKQSLPVSANQPATGAQKDLLEKVSGMELPKRTGDQRPADVYKKPYSGSGAPKVAIVITGVGMVADQSMQALSLPENITLSLSPYAASLDGLREKAQTAGHEIWLDLPMQPKNYPADDAGPLSLMNSDSESENISRLHKVMGSATNYVGVVAGSDENFSGSSEMKPVAAEIDRRGIALLTQQAGFKDPKGASYLRQAERAANSDITAEAAKHMLEEAETLAKKTGSAVVTLPATPAVLDLVKTWSKTADAKGVALAPLSALYAKEQPRTASNE
ncbi:MAG: divergent polysaccharide deacetylase family protein [Rickettsiales bacterium]